MRGYDKNGRKFAADANKVIYSNRHVGSISNRTYFTYAYNIYITRLE